MAREQAWRVAILLKGFVANPREMVLPKVDALVLMSEQEGLPMAIIEALSMGVPVIATAVGGVPEAVIDGQKRAAGRTVGRGAGRGDPIAGDGAGTVATNEHQMHGAFLKSASRFPACRGNVRPGLPKEKNGTKHLTIWRFSFPRGNRAGDTGHDVERTSKRRFGRGAVVDL